MKLAGYDFIIKHRAGKVHNNADGLSRAYAEPAPDTPPDDVIMTETTDTPLPGTTLVAALEAFEKDPHMDGDPPVLYCDEVDTAAQALGPR